MKKEDKVFFCSTGVYVWDKKEKLYIKKPLSLGSKMYEEVPAKKKFFKVYFGGMEL